MRTLGDLHDGPTDLRTPGALVRSIQRSHQVVLPQGPVRGTLMTLFPMLVSAEAAARSMSPVERCGIL